jgi:Flp pilus assembly protein protease CpaA
MNAISLPVVFRENPRRAAWRSAWLAPLIVGPVWCGVVASLFPSSQAATLAKCVLAMLLATCSFTDIRWKRIPNWASYTALAWGLGLNTVHGFLAGSCPGVGAWLGGIGWAQSLQGAGVSFLIMYGVYHLCCGGAGDVKLAVAIGSLVGVEAGVEILVVCHVVAAVVVVFWMIGTVGPRTVAASFARVIGYFLFPLLILPPTAEHHLVLNRPVPMAAFFALATLICRGGFGS